VQDLVVHAVSRDRGDVRIDVRQPAGQVSRVTFQLDDPVEAAGILDQARAWMADGRRLTYVAGPGGAALVDDAEAFWRAFGESPGLRQ
jgi:hypothetical protein